MLDLDTNLSKEFTLESYVAEELDADSFIDGQKPKKHSKNKDSESISKQIGTAPFCDIKDLDLL